MYHEIHFSPNIAIRASLLAAVVLVLLTSAISAGATPPEPQVAQENNSSTSKPPNPDVAVDPIEVASTECEVSQKFPEKVTRWCALITKYADSNDLPADLIAALIWQESGGKPSAYSHSGAVGLMQVMPSDGIASSFMCVNGPCFSNRPTINQLEDPEFNVKYGTRMLARLVRDKGNLRDALKAYGPMDVGYSYADKVLNLHRKYGN